MESNGVEQATGRGVEYDYQTLTYLELLGDGRLSKAYSGFYESAGENVSELNNQLTDIDQSKSRDFVQREVMRIFLSGGMLEQSTYVGHGLKSNEYIGENVSLAAMAAFVLWEGDGISEKVNVDPEILQRVAAEFYSRASKRKGEGSVQIKEDCEVFAAGVAAGLARDALKTSE